jgi:hypothetical protein
MHTVRDFFGDNRILETSLFKGNLPVLDTFLNVRTPLKVYSPGVEETNDL